MNILENSFKVETPCFVVDESKLEENLKLLKGVVDQTNCHILLAQKCFSMYKIYPLIKKYIQGTTASGLYEARLGATYMGGETHIYSPGYKKEEFSEILSYCDHIIFNSLSQWKEFKEMAIQSGKEFGLRINPECSTQEGHEIYNPCAPFSRMGVTRDNLKLEDLEGISGLHFHCLCEQDSDALIATLDAVEEKFQDFLNKVSWINMGGGHHITREGYHIEELISTINRIKNKYQVEVYLEPGEAVALNAGYLVARVLDIIDNGMKIAILDASAACHMPDVLEMPYRPYVIGSGKKGEKAYTYRFGGPTCLAGDIIGDYSFETPLKVGDRVIFCDMAIYSMVKTNTFNGMALPSIYLQKKNQVELIKKFDFEDFKNRLG